MLHQLSEPDSQVNSPDQSTSSIPNATEMSHSNGQLDCNPKTETTSKLTAPKENPQWIDKIVDAQSVLNHKRLKLYKPKYKLTLWDVRDVYDCRIRLKRGRHELLFTVSIANAPTIRVEVSKNDINGSTVTRGDIFVRFYKRYNCDNTHQLEKLLLQRLSDKKIQLTPESDLPDHYAVIPQLRPQTIPQHSSTFMTEHTVYNQEKKGIDDGKSIKSRASSSSVIPLNTVHTVPCSTMTNGGTLKGNPMNHVTTSPHTKNASETTRNTSTSSQSQNQSVNPFMLSAANTVNALKPPQQLPLCPLPLPLLTDAHSKDSTKSQDTISTGTPSVHEPPKKRRRISTANPISASSWDMVNSMNPAQVNMLMNASLTQRVNNNQFDVQQQQKLYNDCKLNLEEMIKVHRSCEGTVNGLSSMNQWFQCMKHLSNGQNRLSLMQSVIKQQHEQFQCAVHAEKLQFDTLERENDVRSNAQRHLQSNLKTYTGQLTSVDAQIRTLVLQRQQINQRVNATKTAMERNQDSMTKYSQLKKRYIEQMGHRVQRIQDGQALVPIIDRIGDRYSDTVQKLRDKMQLIEKEWKSWKAMHVLLWLKQIENGRFGDKKYEKYCSHIVADNVGGIDLVKMNDLSLRLFGIENEDDRTLILNNIERLKNSNGYGDATNVLLQAIAMLEEEEDQKKQIEG